MTITNGYTTLAEIKGYLRNIPDTDVDEELEAAVNAASRSIDRETHRFFYSKTDTTLYFTPVCETYLLVPDLVSVAALKTDEDRDRVYEVTWATTDYDLVPFNATQKAEAEPYTEIRITPEGDHRFPLDARSVEIEGAWGWPAIPETIRQATLIQASRLFKRGETPFSVAGTPETGLLTLPRLDPDVAAMIGPYVLPVVA